MNLYATITSERASKGQGGKWLKINITNAKKEKIISFDVSELQGDYLIQYKTGEGFNPDWDAWWVQKLPTKKAKKQKADWFCENCEWKGNSDELRESPFGGELVDLSYCPKCGDNGRIGANTKQK